MSALITKRIFRHGSTNFGRSAGWWIIVDGTTVGGLKEALVDMDQFWYPYHIRIFDSKYDILKSDYSSWEKQNVCLRSRYSPRYLRKSILISPLMEDGLVWLRDVHVPYLNFVFNKPA